MSDEALLQMQSETTFKSEKRFYKIFESAEELYQWYKQIDEEQREFLESHATPELKKILEKARWTVFAKKDPDYLKNVVLV